MTVTSGRPVVLITGAASGIGAATARALTEQDWIVYATDIDTDFSAAIEATCRCLELDVTDTDQSQAVVDRILEATGRIDVLVNNAGFASPGPVEDVAIEDSRRQFDVLVHGTHRLIQAVLPGMRDRQQGRIIMMSSVLGVAPSPGLGTYGAAKAAVESLTDSLRMELSETPGVSVSLVEPAWVDTEFSASAADRLPTTDRTPAYSEIYKSIEEGWVVDGGPLATTPATVASTVLEAATVDSPAPRYPVGSRSRLIMASRLLPTRVQDLLTRGINQTSITARRCWEFISPDESSTDPETVVAADTDSPSTGSEAVGPDTDSSTVQLSTGHRVSVPLSTSASLSGAVVSASAQAVDSLLPESLRPVRITPSRATVTLLSVAYDRIGTGEIEPYNEVAIILSAVPDTGSAHLPVVSGLSRQVGGYVWQLPVTTEPACALGREIWGYPKSVAEIDISTEDGHTETGLTADGSHVLSFAVDQPPRRSRRFSLSSYTLLDNTLCETAFTFAGQLGVRPMSRRVDWELGEHPWATTLESMELGSWALARFGGDGTVTIGEPTPVDTV